MLVIYFSIDNKLSTFLCYHTPIKECDSMKYAVVFASMTGNTRLLAERIRKELPREQLIYWGEPAEEAREADVLFVGSWTDKGTCCPAIGDFLRSLEGKKVFLFGTAGFGGAQAYFDQIAGRMGENLGESNTLLGHFLCQGKMPQSVRARYEAMEQNEKTKAMLQNFDAALSHPDAADLQALEQAVSRCLTQL